MKRLDLINRVRSQTRDFTGVVFRQQDIIDYLNEAIDRVQQVIPELSPIQTLDDDNTIPSPIPTFMHSLLSSYASARCYDQDDRPFQAITLSNEFEQKLDEFRMKFEMGRIKVYDANGNQIFPFDIDDFVQTNDYFYRGRTLFNTPTPSGGLDNNTVTFDSLSDTGSDLDVTEDYSDQSVNTDIPTNNGNSSNTTNGGGQPDGGSF